VAQGTGALSCELCTSETNTPNATVVVRHPRGGIVQFAACDWCVTALRRLTAATGGHAVFALAEGGIPAPASRPRVPSGARPVSPPVLVLEFQSNREGVAYWATGLEPAYLESAVARAHRVKATAAPA
jgi:hypothetical protein